MIVAENRTSEAPPHHIIRKSSSRRVRRGGGKQNADDNTSPLVFLHHERRLGGADSASGPQITAEIKLWLQQLTPLLAVYDYDCKDIIELLRQCDFDSVRVQAAVDAIYEERQGHELAEWQTQRRPQKKSTVVGPDNTAADRSGSREMRSRRRRQEFSNAKSNDRQRYSRLPPRMAESSSNSERQTFLATAKAALQANQSAPSRGYVQDIVVDSTQKLPGKWPAEKTYRSMQNATQSQGSWAKVVAGPTINKSSVTATSLEPDLNSSIPTSPLEDLASASEREVLSNVVLTPKSGDLSTSPETVSQVSQMSVAAAVPPSALPEPSPSSPLAPSRSPRIVASSPLLTHDVVLPVSVNRSDDVVLPYAASRRDFTGLKFGNISKLESSQPGVAAEIFFGGRPSTHATTVEAISRLEQARGSVVPPGLVAEPKLPKITQDRQYPRRGRDSENSYNFSAVSATAPAFPDRPLYDSGSQHSYGWEKTRHTDASADCTLGSLTQRDIEGSLSQAAQHGRRQPGHNLKNFAARRGPSGFYRNQHYTVPQYNYENQYGWSNGSYMPQSFGGAGVRTDFISSELDAHAAAAAAVLKSQQQVYPASYYPYETSYDGGHLREDSGAYYSSYNGQQIHRHPATSNVQSSLGQHRNGKHSGPISMADTAGSRRNSGTVSAPAVGCSSFGRTPSGYGNFNNDRGSYEYGEPTTRTVVDRERRLDSVGSAVPFRQQHHVTPQNLVLLGTGSQASMQGMQQSREYSTGAAQYAHSNYFYDNANSGEYNAVLQQQHINTFQAQRPANSTMDHVYGATAVYGNGYGTQYSSGAAANRHL